MTLSRLLLVIAAVSASAAAFAHEVSDRLGGARLDAESVQLEMARAASRRAAPSIPLAGD